MGYPMPTLGNPSCCENDIRSVPSIFNPAKRATSVEMSSQICRHSDRDFLKIDSFDSWKNAILKQDLSSVMSTTTTYRGR